MHTILNFEKTKKRIKIQRTENQENSKNYENQEIK